MLNATIFKAKVAKYKNPICELNFSVVDNTFKAAQIMNELIP
jgi:hypothetical protein